MVSMTIKIARTNWTINIKQVTQLKQYAQHTDGRGAGATRAYGIIQTSTARQGYTSELNLLGPADVRLLT